MNFCARCRKRIEGEEIKFAREGSYIGMPLCRRCRREIEAESRNRYRRGRGKEYSRKDLYETDVY